MQIISSAGHKQSKQQIRHIRGRSRYPNGAWALVIANLPRSGRIQRQIRRAFVANGGKPLSTLELIPWCYPNGRKPWSHHDVRRAAFKYAVPLGRTRPVFWAPLKAPVRRPNAELRPREHLTEREVEKLSTSIRTVQYH